jgi:hypothetical protein
MSAVDQTVQSDPYTTPVLVPGTGYKADPTKEYVSADQLVSVWSNMLKTLSWAIDDVSRDFGDDVWERMNLDPIVSATLTILMSSVLEDGFRFSPAISDPKDPDIELATYIHKRATKMFSSLTTRLSDVAWDMLRSFHLGNRVSETIWKYVEEDGRLFLDVAAIKPRPRRSLAFVVDVYGNHYGFTIVDPKNFRVPNPDAVIAIDSKEFLPRDKFWVHSFRMKDEDPRGTSILRPAFSSWVGKIQILAERQKHLSRFGSPTIIGMTPEDAKDVPILDAVTQQPTGRYINAQHALYLGLLQVHNGTVMATIGGTTFQVIQAQGGGEAFTAGLSYEDKAIVKTILTQTLATEDSAHQARAAAQVHKGSIDTIVKQSKQGFGDSFRDDVLKVWVRRNWGPQYEHLAPLVSLGVTEAPDLAAMMNAVAALFKIGFFSKSQITGLDELLNLTSRLPSELESLSVVPAPPPAPNPPANIENKPKTPSGGDQNAK